VFAGLGTVLLYSLGVDLACGADTIFKILARMFSETSGIEVILVIFSFFFLRAFIVEALVFFLWRKGMIANYSPAKAPLGEAGLETVEFIPEKDKVKHAKFGLFFYFPLLISIAFFGWFFLAKRLCT
jgi:hypothetical protein